MTTESSYIRALGDKVPDGDTIKTYKDGDDHIHAVGIADAEGSQVGTPSMPLTVGSSTLESMLIELQKISQQLEFITEVQVTGQETG